MRRGTRLFWTVAIITALVVGVLYAWGALAQLEEEVR